MSDDDEFVPRIDLSSKYEVVVDNQTKSLQNFDDKIWRTMRLNGVIIGTGVAGISLVLNGDGSLPNPILPVVVVTIVGLASLLIALGFGIRSYRSAVFAFGPSSDLGDEMKDSNPDPDDYKEAVLDSYVSAISKNSTALGKKEKGFRRSLAFLVFGLTNYSLGIALLVWSLPKNPAYGVMLLGLVGGGIGTYLSVYRKDTASEDDGEEEDG